ncbi:MAG: glutamate--tRNA ligase [Patescibacteria group bacterium]|nr:glutamate--tRNA ligase [Patescibacteria group bacterium]
MSNKQEGTRNKEIRVRMAPSPTGFLHIGTARATLFNWLFARHHGGMFMLRIEDTDAERSKTEYEIQLIEALHWLGLDWDEGPDYVDGKLVSKGQFSPYRQSERQEIYKKYVEQLLAEGKAYYCYCTKEDIEAQQQAMAASGLPPKYTGHCRNLAEPPANWQSRVVRFKTPENKISFHDLIRGKVEFDASLLGDMIITRSDGSVLYNLAVVIDDHLMGITHVIRGEDHISNTPKQILFQQALGFPQPIYGHLPLILNADRSKMSKRKNKVALEEYRNAGYLSDAMVNFLALLGWHPKDDREVLSRDELIELFDINRVQKAGAVFNQDKLDWLNREYLKKMGDEEILNALMENGAWRMENRTNKTLLKKIIPINRGRASTLRDFIDLGKFFFDLPDYAPAMLVWKDGNANDTAAVLKTLHEKLKSISPENFENRGVITSAVQEIVNGRLNRGEVLWPLRVALSGQQSSPDPLEIMMVLGKEESLRRLRMAMDKISNI